MIYLLQPFFDLFANKIFGSVVIASFFVMVIVFVLISSQSIDPLITVIFLLPLVFLLGILYVGWFIPTALLILALLIIPFIWKLLGQMY